MPPAQGRTSRRSDAVCLAILACLPVLLEARALMPGRVLSSAALLYWYPPWQYLHPGPVAADPLQSDMAFVFQPWLLHTRREIRAGRLPLWNPNADAGVPFLANMQSGVFCPFNIPAWVLPPGFAIALAAVAKFEVAGLGTYLFLRLLGTAPPAALVGGTAFMFSGFIVAWLGWSLGSVGVWLPALFAAVEWLKRTGTRRAAGLLAAVVAVQWLGGHPETSVHILGAAVLWALWRGASPGSPAPGGALPFLGRVALGVVLGTGAAAVVLLPFLAYLPGTTAFIARRAATGMPVWPPSLAMSLLVPRYFGHPGSGSLWCENFTSNYTELSGTVGLVPWVLLPVALLARAEGRRTALFFAALALACLPVIYLVPVVTPLLASLPGAPVMAHIRLVLILGFALSVLGGLGADRLLAAPAAERRRFVWPVTLVLLALLGWMAWRFRADRDAITAARAMWYVRGEVVRAAVLLLASGLLVRHLLIRPRPVGWSAGALLAVQLASVVPFASTFYPVIPAAEFFPRTPAIEFLAKHAGEARVVLPNPNVADVYGLADPTGCDAMNPARTARLVTGRTDFGRFGNDPVILPKKPNRRVLDLLAVRYLLTWPKGPAPVAGLLPAYDGPDARIWRNPTALPLAFLVARVRQVTDEEALRLIERGGVDLKTEALAAGVSASAETPRVASTRAGTAAIESHGPGSLVVRTTAPGASFLVFLESWDSGWTVAVDGVRARVVRTDYAFCGVAVPAGSHRVVFAYRPVSFTLGLIVSAMAISGIVLLAASGRQTGAA